MKHLAMLVHLCRCKYYLDTQLLSNLSQYSQSTMVEICKQDRCQLNCYGLYQPMMVFAM